MIQKLRKQKYKMETVEMVEEVVIDDDLVGWLVFILMGFIVSMMMQVNVVSSNSKSSKLMMNPQSIFGVFSGAAEDAVKSSFGEVEQLLSVLVSTAGIIGDSLNSIRDIVRSFFIMINNFTSIAQQQIQGLIGGVMSLSQSMKKIFGSMMSMFTILI